MVVLDQSQEALATTRSECGSEAVIAAGDAVPKERRLCFLFAIELTGASPRRTQSLCVLPLSCFAMMPPWSLRSRDKDFTASTFWQRHRAPPIYPIDVLFRCSYVLRDSVCMPTNKIWNECLTAVTWRGGRYRYPSMTRCNLGHQIQCQSTYFSLYRRLAWLILCSDVQRPCKHRFKKMH